MRSPCNHIYTLASARRHFPGSVVTPVGHLESQNFCQHRHLRPSDDTADRLGGLVSYDPDGILDGGIRGSGAVLHPTSGRRT